MRPRQWPILSIQLAVGVLCAAPVHALLLAHPTYRLLLPGAGFWFQGAVLTWFTWVVCLNGGTLAYNSAFDRDRDDVAYLDDPPEPPLYLAILAQFIMLAGLPGAYLVDARYAQVMLVCVILSVLYSRPRPRLKSVPGVDLAVNMLGYGAGTTLAGLLAGQALAYAEPVGLQASEWLLVAGFALLFGSFYPLTQFYQIESDAARGDRTLAVALGVRSSLSLSLGLGILAALCLLAASADWPGPVLPLFCALLYWVGLLWIWRLRARGMTGRQHRSWMYLALVIWALIDLIIVLTRYLDVISRLSRR
jgi:4-hydroxybenzoate polyprenyltransferase